MAKCACGCCHAVDHGACDKFELGANSRCVYCDHGPGCHPGKGPMFNGPLQPGVRAAVAQKESAKKFAKNETLHLIAAGECAAEFTSEIMETIGDCLSKWPNRPLEWCATCVARHALMIDEG